MLGFKGVPSPLFEWIQSDMSQAFEPIFLSYTSLFDSMPIGLFFEVYYTPIKNSPVFY